MEEETPRIQKETPPPSGGRHGYKRCSPSSSLSPQFYPSHTPPLLLLLQKAEHEGRRACTFHNQRDFIFFRQHRYIFEDEGKSVRLQELGPRFTLKLKWLMSGSYDTKFAEYEWFLKRHEMQSSRRRFML